MLIKTPIGFIPDPGRKLTDEETEALKELYPWPRPERKLCRRETNNDNYRLGRK